ncbi:HD domain-containing protein [Hazenella sp. IB182357]|uniref:HD domain-containing protein n=1 Tax=Polycladospora coralii TaxID=2771432 RepID=A0A926NDG4_9BACL|nr:HD domain-containing protein [Polycladospora coralii]MBD1371433.1 HD domain-containing protein [Polycladospora coralii]
MSVHLNHKQERVISLTEHFLKNELYYDNTGHDWWHISRVTNIAKKIAIIENADVFICIIASLLHDIADEKISGDEEIGLYRVEHWLKKNEVLNGDIAHILEIISTMSYKGGTNKCTMSTLEGKIVQDADRLDAIGAIGISRVMCYSAVKQRPIHHPELTPRTVITLDDYRNSGTAIMHFYEKLLKLKDLMNTDYAKQLAAGRHEVLEKYLEQFLYEWDGIK